jgi:hypothetical protein
LQSIGGKIVYSQLLWFNVECPNRYKDFKDPVKLRSIFMDAKKGKQATLPDYVKL